MRFSIAEQQYKCILCMKLIAKKCIERTTDEAAVIYLVI